MAREIVVWCDVCYASEELENERGSEVTITIDRGSRTKPVRVALCERHDKELLGTLADTLADFGMEVGGPAAMAMPRISASPADEEEDTFTCPVPDCRTRTRDWTAKGLRQHLNAAHGLKMADARRLYPRLNALPTRGRPATR